MSKQGFENLARSFMLIAMVSFGWAFSSWCWQAVIVWSALCCVYLAICFELEANNKG